MKAKYTVFVPNMNRQVAVAAHHYLSYGPLATHGATVHHGDPYDTLVTFAEDTPEMDSHLKQLGVFVGELSNVPAVDVVKEGKAVHTWTMHNPYYVPLPDTVQGTSPMMGQPETAQAMPTVEQGSHVVTPGGTAPSPSGP